MKINGIDKDGNINEYDVILTYYDEIYKKDYIAYTDNKYNDNNELNIYINAYKPNINELISNPLENKEYNYIKTKINSILLSMKIESEKLDSN